MASRIKIMPARPITQNVLFTSGKVKGFDCGGYRTAQRLTTLVDFTRIKSYGANAVSYTHLDVYKRQALSEAKSI